MKTEFECRFININLDEMRAKLAVSGFACTQPEFLMQRQVFKIPTGDFNREWLRLRHEFDGVSLTYKSRAHGGTNSVSSAREIEISVGNFDDTRELLLASGMIQINSTENKREKWVKDNIEICLDTWPGLEPYCEIESDSEDTVRQASASLGFDYNDAMFGNVVEVYERVLGIPTDKFHDMTEITFANPPKKFD